MLLCDNDNISNCKCLALSQRTERAIAIDVWEMNIKIKLMICIWALWIWSGGWWLSENSPRIITFVRRHFYLYFNDCWAALELETIGHFIHIRSDGCVHNVIDGARALNISWIQLKLQSKHTHTHTHSNLNFVDLFLYIDWVA